MSATDPVGLLNISAELEELMEQAGEGLTLLYDRNDEFRDKIHMAIFNSMERGGKDAYLDAIAVFEMTYLY